MLIYFQKEYVSAQNLDFLLQTIGQKHEKKIIMDNLEESIIIIDQNNGIDYMNDTFINHLKEQISELSMPEKESKVFSLKTFFGDQAKTC